jgi:DNA-binding NarL/FixJ family response regulator
MRSMRIFIASADERLRLGLLLFLDQEPGMVVNAMSDRSEGLLVLVETSQSEVLLLDYELAKESTAGLVRSLHRLESRPKIIILSIDPRLKEKILAAGADGFISKDAPPDDLLPIINRMR